MQVANETIWSQWLSQMTNWFGLALLVLLPLIYGPGGATPIAKMVLVNGIGLVLLVAAGLRFLERRMWRQAGWWRLSWPELALVVFGGVLILVTLVAADRSLSWWGAKHHGLGALTYLFLLSSAIILGRAVRHKHFLQQCVWGMVFGLALVSIHALSQALGIDLPVYRSIQQFSFAEGQRRAFAAFGNPIHLTIYLVLVLPLLFSWWLTLTSSVQRWFVGSVLVAGMLAVFASLAGHSGAQRFIDSVYLGLFGMLGLWLWLVRSTNPERRKILKWLTYLTFAAFILSCLIVRWPGVLKSSGVRLAHIVPQSDAFTTRYANWEMARRVAAQRPWLGYGLEAYQEQYHQVYTLRLTGFDPQESHLDRAHQVALDWLVTTGWIGWLAYLVIVGLGLRAGWQILDNPDQTRYHWFARGALFAVLVYQSQLWLNFASQPDLLIFFLLIASLGAVAELPVVAHKQSRPQPFQGHYWGLGVLLVLSLPVGLWFTSFRFWAADSETQAGIRLIEAQPARPADQQDYQTGLELLHRAQQHAPVFSDSDRILADGYRRAGKFAEALATVVGARKRTPANRELLEEEGQVRLDWAEHDPSKIADAQAFLTRAFQETKFWTPIFQDQLQLAAIMHDPAAAETIKRQAIAWAPNQFLNWDIELGITFAQRHQPAIAIAHLKDQLLIHERADDTQGWFALGYAYTQEHQLTEALATFETCTKLGPRYLPCWSGRWNTALALQRTEDLPTILHVIQGLNPQVGNQLAHSLPAPSPPSN